MALQSEFQCARNRGAELLQCSVVGKNHAETGTACLVLCDAGIRSRSNTTEVRLESGNATADTFHEEDADQSSLIDFPHSFVDKNSRFSIYAYADKPAPVLEQSAELSPAEEVLKAANINPAELSEQEIVRRKSSTCCPPYNIVLIL